MTADVYQNCPDFENEHYLLRMVKKEDKADLLRYILTINLFRFLTAITEAVTIFTTQLRAGWNRRLIIGYGSIAGSALFGGRL